jgi:hypothetical protein
MTAHIMLDLETLASTEDAAIIQIAAVAFDPVSGEIASEFSVHVRHPSGRIDPGTVFWWMQQAAAPTVAKACEASTYDTKGALVAFASWVVGQGEIGGVWSFPASFDLPVLSSAYARENAGPKPWHYRAERCARTVLALAGFKGKDRPDVPAPEGYQAHDALSDCRMQVRWLIAAAQKAGVQL